MNKIYPVSIVVIVGLVIAIGVYIYLTNEDFSFGSPAASDIQIVSNRNNSKSIPPVSGPVSPSEKSGAITYVRGVIQEVETSSITIETDISSKIKKGVESPFPTSLRVILNQETYLAEEREYTDEEFTQVYAEFEQEVQAYFTEIENGELDSEENPPIEPQRIYQIPTTIDTFSEGDYVEVYTDTSILGKSEIIADELIKTLDS